MAAGSDGSRGREEVVLVMVVVLGKGRERGEVKESMDGNKRKEEGKDIKGDKCEMTGAWKGIEKGREKGKGGKKEGMEQ